MEDVIGRIGLSKLIEVVVMCWNEVLIFLLLLVLLIGVRRDRQFSRRMRIDIPVSRDLIVFDCIVLAFNFCDIFDELCAGMTAPIVGRLMPISAYLCHVFGQWHSLFVLSMFWYRVVVPLRHTALRRLICVIVAVQVLMTAMILTAPLTRFVYWIENNRLCERTPGYSLWVSVTMFMNMTIGAALIIFWQHVEKDYRGSIAAAVFLPISGFFFSLLTGFDITNSLAAVTAVIIFWLHLYRKAKAAVYNAYELSRTRALLAENSLALEQSKNEMLVAQIQPHFINNSLMAIAARCHEYPDIYNSIMHFSCYLRSHFEALGSERKIPFSKEMENIEAYLDLVQEQYQERLTVEYQIDCDDFSVPALSVQPLVENAVQHGISMYEGGGTVTIRSFREGTSIVIEVTDEGRGRSSITPQQKKRKGIGIDNVRARLQSMSEGILEILPQENGTTARITLTRYEEESCNGDTIR